MRVYVFGANGMLGTYVYRWLKDRYSSIAIGREDFDVEKGKRFGDLDGFLSSFDLAADDVIVNCIGLLPHRYNSNSLEKQEFDNKIIERFLLVNSIFPQNLEKVRLKTRCRVIHITSDCVYIGDKGRYTEDVQPDLYNVYGLSKILGECSNLTNIRTTFIGKEKRNKHSLYEWLLSSQNSSIKGFANYYWNGLTCLELAKVIEKMIGSNIFWEGTRHIFSPEVVSKYDLANMVNKVNNLNMTVIEHYLPERIDRSLGSKYETNDAFNIPSLRKQIRDLASYNIE